jgi:hypothetical protein
MVLKYHRADYKALPNEDAVREALGKGTLPPGIYQVPLLHEHERDAGPREEGEVRKGSSGDRHRHHNGFRPWGNIWGSGSHSV